MKNTKSKFIRKNHKSIVAFLLILVCLIIYVLKDENATNGLRTILQSIIFSSSGFIFGRGKFE